MTRDLGFSNPLRFDLTKLLGLVILRFPNEISVDAFYKEVKRLVEKIKKESFRKKIIIIEPGSVRSRKLP